MISNKELKALVREIVDMECTGLNCDGCILSRPSKDGLTLCQKLLLAYNEVSQEGEDQNEGNKDNAG